MQNFSYKARDDMGKVVTGTMLADDETDLANKISALGYFLVRAKTASVEVEGKSKPPKLNAKEVLNFTIHLVTLLDAGVSLTSALRDLARDAESEKLQRVVDDVRFRVESGSTLKDALSLHPRSFSKLFIAIVGAGETTGKLGACLGDLAEVLDWQIELKSKMQEAATYPIILFTVMLGVVALLVIKVIPTFEPIFKSAGAALPLPTQIVLAVSFFVRKLWYVGLGIIGFLVFVYKTYYATSKGKYQIDSAKLKMPLFGPLLRKVALSRFCHTFSLSLKSGINVLSALDIALGVIGNSRIEHAVNRARDSVNVGEKLSVALKISGEFPPLVLRMIGVGEQTGALTQTLTKVNQFYDREVPSTIRRLFALFEPIMIVVMGVVVGGIALSIFLPMFQMAQIAGG